MQPSSNQPRQHSRQQPQAYFYQPQSQLLQPYYAAKMAAAGSAGLGGGGGLVGSNGHSNGPGLADLSQGSCDNTPGARPPSAVLVSFGVQLDWETGPLN